MPRVQLRQRCWRTTTWEGRRRAGDVLGRIAGQRWLNENCNMKTQDSGAVRDLREQVRERVGAWPTELAGAGRLEPVLIRLSGPVAAAGDDLAEGVTRQLGVWGEGAVLVVHIPRWGATLPEVASIARAWGLDRREPPAGSVSRGVGFAVSADEVAGLELLWQRAAQTTRALGLALMCVDEDAHLHVHAGVRTSMRTLVSLLEDLPVVSSELLASLPGFDPAPGYRWSQRVAALRRAGLVVPLGEAVVGRQMRSRHAEVLKRLPERRPTQLYRSVAHDLSRAVESMAQRGELT